ncbi:MAG: hypothetical protein COA90_00565 [Gammaproteobacteria bacterium]|nr:MAG: hypothetical protein COA90_00565 [Gammaproteobacteria bacterium]
MNKNHIIIASLFMLSLSTAATAAPTASANDMQGCQAYISFINDKVDSTSKKYPTDELAKIKSGLNIYNNYIQTEVITPTLNKLSSNNAEKVAEYQQQIDSANAQIVKSLHASYPQDRFFMDFAVSINDGCVKKSVPAEGSSDYQSLETALKLIIKLARQN